MESQDNFKPEISQKQINANNNSQIAIWPRLEVKAETILDLTDFTDYRSVCLPIQCGPKFGIVCTFSHKDNLNSQHDTLYRAGLKELIEKKKHIESEKLNDDVGPAYTVATLIEEGEYQEFLTGLGSRISSNGFEHVIQVKQNGAIYHMLPLQDESIFGNIEQLGLIRFSIFQAFRDKPLTATKDEINEAAREWILSNNSQNAKKFRQILIESKVDRIKDMGRQFANCAIYSDISERIKTEFQLQQLLEKLSEKKE